LSETGIHRVVIAGTGNVASRLGHAFKAASIQIIEVYGRNTAKAKALATSLGTSYVTEISAINVEADLYVLAVSDDAIAILSQMLPPLHGLVVHTSASAPLPVGSFSHTGVLYPLQTMLSHRNIEFSEVPLFIETNSDEQTKRLCSFAGQLSAKVIVADQLTRMRYHLAAVFASNFTNHLYSIAFELLAVNGLTPELLHPLILETALKAVEGNPEDSQTGPAIRGDVKTIKTHLDLLDKRPDYQQLYENFTGLIKNYYSKRNE